MNFSGTEWATANVEIENLFDGKSTPALFVTLTLDADEDLPSNEQLRGFFTENVFTSMLPGESKEVTFVAKQ